MQTIHRKHRYIAISFLYLVGLLFFSLTSPERLPVWALVLPFLYIFITVYITISTLMSRALQDRTSIAIIPAVMATIVTLLLLLSSLRQVTIRDIILGAGIVGLLAWYLRRLQ